MMQRFLGGAAHAERSGGTLMSQFLIVGAGQATHEDSLVADASVLYVYPPGSSLVDASLPLFCFPEAVRLKKLRRTASNSRINEVRYSNLATLESPRSSFTFLLTGHEEVLYGVCVHAEELLDELPVLVDDRSAGPASSPRRLRAGSRQSLAPVAGAPPALCAPRCYCLVSRFPFFKLHFDFLYALVAKDRHARMVGGADVASELESLLSAYSQQKLLDDRRDLSFRLPGDVHEFAFHLPGTDQDSLLEAFCGSRVLSLGPDVLTTLVAALLAECKCVLVSELLGVVSSTVLGLVPLLKPLVWQGSLVPILPAAMMEALEAPVPFVFGVRGRPDALPPPSAMPGPDELVVLDLDKNVFVALPKDLAPVPRSDELKRSLKSTTANLTVVREFVRQLLTKADTLRPASGWDQPGASDKAAAAAPKNERAFWTKFLATQLFHGHIGARLDESEALERQAREKQQAQQRTLAAKAAGARFDALIAQEKATCKELEALLEDHTRKLTMARERLEALLAAKFDQRL